MVQIQRLTSGPCLLEKYKIKEVFSVLYVAPVEKM
jgi:hypothetical protein